MTEVLSFRVNPEQKEKLRLLAVGEGTTVQGIVHRLIELAPVEQIEVVRRGLTLRTSGKNSKSALQVDGQGAFAN